MKEANGRARVGTVSPGAAGRSGEIAGMTQHDRRIARGDGRPPAADRARELFARSAIDSHVLFDDVTMVLKSKTARTVVFERMSARLPKGRRIGVFGPKRSGKSTLVKLICGVAVPRTGKIHRSEKISWPLGQKSIVSPVLSVRDNIVFAANLMGRDPRLMVEFVDDICMLGSNKRELLRDLPRHMTQRLNLVLPLLGGFECYVIEGQLPFASMRLPDDRLEMLTSEIKSKDLIVVTNRPRFAANFVDTGAVIENKTLRFCASVAEAAAIADDMPEGTDGGEDGGGETEEEEANAFW